VRHAPSVGPLLLSVLVAGCEPTSITEAHQQLERGGLREVEFSIPLTHDTITVGEFLGDDTTTTPDGLLAVTIAPETLGVAVGQQLQFDNVTFTRLKVNVPAGAGPGNIPVNGAYAALAGEPRILAVDTVVASSGSITVTTFNRLPGTLSYTLTLNGFRDSLGAVLTRNGVVPAAAGTGTYTSASVSFDLTKVKIAPGSVNAALAGTVNLTGTTTAAVQDSSVIQSGSGVIVVEQLKGSLDPTVTPELILAVEESDEIPSSNVDFGQLEDPIRNARLNDARIGLTAQNTSNAPYVLTNFNLGVVKLTPAGDIPRDGSNNPIYEVDSLGVIQVPVADSGATTLTVARMQATAVTLQAARLVDRLVDLLLTNQRAAVIGRGTVRVGDGAASSILRADLVSLRVAVTVVLDFTIPLAGVTFDTLSNADGPGFDPPKVDDVVQHFVSASARLIVTNGTPFGVEVLAAVVPDTLRSGEDADSVFRRTDRVEIGPVQVSGSPVDAQGRVTTPVLDTADINLTAQQVRVVLGEGFGTGMRIRLIAGPTGRGAIRASDRIILRARATVRFQAGGN